MIPMGQNERNAKTGTSVESCSLLLQTSFHFTTDIFSVKSRVCICKLFVNKLPSPAVRRCNSFCFYGIAAAMGLRHTNGNIGVTISNIRPECFSFSLPLLQFQKRFLASSANALKACRLSRCPPNPVPKSKDRRLLHLFSAWFLHRTKWCPAEPTPTNRGCQTVPHPPVTALHRRFPHKEYYQNSAV